ncbi:caspase-10-like [Glandiceps talaboti]
MYCTDARVDLSYRKILKNVDDNLMSRDLNSLKFLCRDLIATGKLETAQKPRDIFQELEYKGYLGPGDKLLFLADLLNRIHRVDLIKKLGIGNTKEIQALLKQQHRPGPKFNNFRLLLISVCDNLTNDDLDSMKFYCQPFMNKSVLEDIDDAPSLLSYLEQRDHISEDNVDFLEEMIELLGNEELSNQIQQYKDTYSSLSNHMETKVQYPIVDQHQVVPSGADTHYPYQVQLDRNAYLPPPQPAYEVTQRLNSAGRQHVLMTPGDFTQPVMSAQFMQPTDNIQAYGAYVGGTPAEPHASQLQQGKKYVGVLPAQPDARLFPPRFGGHDDLPNETAITENVARQPQQPVEHREIPGAGDQLSNQTAVSENVASQPQEHEIHVQTEKQGSAKVMEPQVWQSTKEMMEELGKLRLQREDIEMPCYPMTTSPLGICAIINNEEFYLNSDDPSSRTLEDRQGTKVDRDNLAHLFQTLDFEVTVKDNMTAFEMFTWLEEIGRSDHSHYSCFVCCILSHGSSGKVYGCDGVPINVSDLTQSVKGTRSRTLVGKPKLFFMQACQGKRDQSGEFEADSVGDNEPPDTIPNEADFMLGYATVPGFVSYRSKTHGSWYITKLVECIDRYRSNHDLMSIMIKVNDEVAKAIAATRKGDKKQVPAPLVTLRKKLYFKPEGEM